jgi:hypothetical protein
MHEFGAYKKKSGVRSLESESGTCGVIVRGEFRQLRSRVGFSLCKLFYYRGYLYYFIQAEACATSKKTGWSVN